MLAQDRNKDLQIASSTEIKLTSLGKVERGLVVCNPWIDMLLDGTKTWEIRSTLTHIRGPIGLISKGSGQVSGIVTIEDCLGPLTYRDFIDPHARKAHSETELRRLPYEKTYAWVCKNPVKLTTPVPYKHNSGAVIFVRFAPEVSVALGEYLKF